MKILHTSDWHIGHSFHGRRRDEEFSAFLKWLSRTIRERKIELLLISGDVFDTSAPGNAAVRMYYDFLNSLRGTSCRNVVITGGNHDSPSFLNAPRELLRSGFGIYVFGGAMKDPADELVVIEDPSGSPACLIGAMPYLRDSDLISASFGETPDSHETRLRNAFREHCRILGEAAELKRGPLPIPFIMMGHFYLAGAHLGNDDGVREYVGGLARADLDLLPANLDYAALGHLHQPQEVGSGKFRYCGSPLKMSFSDTDRRVVFELDFSGRDFTVTELEVPHFISILSLHGTWDEILPELTEAAESPDPVYCRVIVSDLSGSELLHRTETLFRGRMKNFPLILQSEKLDEVGSAAGKVIDVEELSESDVFELLLKRKNISDNDMPLLRSLYQKAMTEYFEKE